MEEEAKGLAKGEERGREGGEEARGGARPSLQRGEGAASVLEWLSSWTRPGERDALSGVFCSRTQAQCWCAYSIHSYNNFKSSYVSLISVH